MIRTGKVVDRSLLAIALVLGAVFCAIAILGAVTHYSAIPFWDMWDGEIDFFMKSGAGESWRWFGQHNEHRIVLSRALFWLDLSWFGGQGISLIVANYLIVAGGLTAFLFFLRDRLSGWGEPVFWLLAALATAALTSWIQQNNLTWGFQSQFFLAQVLPLAALYFLHRSERDDRYSRSAWAFFGVACLLGFAAAGSMANGVLSLPVMLAAAALMRSRRIVILLLLAAITVALYLHGYVQPPAHGSLVDTFVHHPVAATKFTLTYLGGPVSYLPHLHDKPVAPLLVGAGLIIASIAALYLALTSAESRTSGIALVAFIGYICATAMLTAGGRAFEGVQAALASRYMTPALMAWTALVVFYAPWLRRLARVSFAIVAAPALLALLAFLPSQLEALKPWDKTAADWRLGGLAMALGVRDEAAIGQIYPFTDRGMAIADEAVSQRLSMFSSPTFADIRALLGKQGGIKPSGVCSGEISAVGSIPGETKALRLTGVLSGVPAGRKPARIALLDPQRRIVGWAVRGVQTDAQAAAGEYPIQGYLLPAAATGELTISTLNGRCEAKAHGSLPPFQIMPANSPLTAEPDLVTEAGLVDAGVFLAPDFRQTTAHRIAVYASRVHGDADTGDIGIRIHRGQFIYFCAGPTPGHQILTVVGDDRFRTELPAGETWIKLVFSEPLLPDEFIVRISDKGAGWGEWSGVALATAPPSKAVK